MPATLGQTMAGDAKGTRADLGVSWYRSGYGGAGRKP